LIGNKARICGTIASSNPTFLLSTVVVSIVAPQIALAEKSAKDYINEAKTHYQNRNLDQAIKKLNQAIQLNSNNASYYRFRGFVYKEQDKFTKALENYNQAIQLINPCRK